MIVLGEHDLERNPNNNGAAADVIYRGVEKVIIHEDYDPDFQGGTGPNNIALIRVNETIPLYDENPKLSNVRPICLPWSINDPGRELVDGDMLKVLGWGRTTNDRVQGCLDLKKYSAGAPVLQEVNAPFNSWKECKEKIKFPSGFVVDTDSQMCAGGIFG